MDKQNALNDLLDKLQQVEGKLAAEKRKRLNAENVAKRLRMQIKRMKLKEV